MLRSMTGFGKFELAEGDRKVSVEMKSVNHRYLELGIKMPRVLNFLESDIRTKLKEFLNRGKVDVYVTYENLSKGNERIKYNQALAKEYYQCYKEISRDLGIENDIKTSYIMKSPDVVTVESQQEDEEAVKSIVIKAIEKAAENLVSARTAEGERLRDDLITKLDGITSEVEFITKKSPIIITEYREKITDRIHELLEDTQIDESRIAQEVTIFADKVCVDEELVRLDSHVKSMRDMLYKTEAVGRSLDFIAQEMNREANTILSKTTDAEISHRAIGLKTDIEKVREQIQNIE